MDLGNIFCVCKSLALELETEAELDGFHTYWQLHSHKCFQVCNFVVFVHKHMHTSCVPEWLYLKQHPSKLFACAYTLSPQ